ncbi:MAG TPA: 3-oxoacyl-[acyl-carrier-protein] reductase [bacterium]|nr:3-oxoacyl-[acyl-carrier-protein] reductase [bacterium]
MSLKDKVAVVTGGNRGIGKEIALTLAQAGAQVAICGTNEETLKAAASQIEALGVKSFYLKTDVSKAADVEAFAAKVLETFGKVDILVNNAGITKDNLLLRMGEDQWDDVIAVNLKSAFLMTKLFVKPMMKARQGRIVNLSSIVGVRGNGGQANYAASKAGLIGFTKTVAREFASRGITCNAVAPGFIQTDMTHALGDKAKEELMKEIPLGFLGESKDVAAAVLFLASDEARYITGQVLCVDGGMVI